MFSSELPPLPVVSPPAAAYGLSPEDELPHPARVPAANAATNATLTNLFFITVSLSFLSFDDLIVVNFS